MVTEQNTTQVPGLPQSRLAGLKNGLQTPQVA